MRSELIIGTAGHIDHGKTTLVHSLCGVQLDSTPEEKERGITINLGFAHKLLPSGKMASFIDVPGHEKLIRTMISGAASMDAVLLCVSAVDGVMPQTKEHLSILKLLGLTQGIVALTMSDLVDEEMIELALLDIEELIEGSFLEHAPIIITAAGPNPKGIEELAEAIDAISVQNKKDSFPFRLSVDRCFLQKGFGVIITGTARGQKLEVGSSIMLMPEGIEGRVRSIQHHGSEQKHTQAGERTAINIVGIEKEQVQRGALLCTAETIPQTSIIDVRYHHLGDAPQLKDGSRVRILQGSMEVLARFSIVSDQDELEEGPLLLQLRTEKPIITLPNDRFILRQESPLRTLGGGVVLDPWAQRFRKKYKKRTNDQLLNIESGDRQLLLERRGISGASQACIALWECEGISLDRQWVSSRIIENEIPRIIEKLVDWHKQNPLQIGCPIKELVHHHPLPISAKGYGLLIEEAQKKGSLSRPEKGIVALPDFSIELTAEQDKKKSSILETITSSNLEGVPLSNYSTEPLINFLISNGALLRIQQQLVSQKSIQALLSRLDEYFSIHKILTPNAFKEQTQLSRKYAIPMLEWLDTKGYTLRTGEGRIKREHS